MLPAFSHLYMERHVDWALFDDDQIDVKENSVRGTGKVHEICFQLTIEMPRVKPVDQPFRIFDECPFAPVAAFVLG